MPNSIRRSVVILAAVLSALRVALPAEPPLFRLDFRPCEATVELPRAGAVESELRVWLETVDNPDPGYGAQGWSLGIVAEGASIASITTRGTMAAEETDDPPGLRYLGFDRTELAQDDFGPCDGLSGAVSAVVLSFTEPITLPAEGPVPVARLVLAIRAPSSAGETKPVTLSFADGCRGAGGPVANLITWWGQAVSAETKVCEIGVLAAESRFLRGDATGDGSVDISDALSILGCKFLGDPCPSCRDAADSNDDGSLNVSDAVHILSYLFLGGEPPLAPGPETCGIDPTEDELPECRYRSCDA